MVDPSTNQRGTDGQLRRQRTRLEAHRSAHRKALVTVVGVVLLIFSSAVFLELIEEGEDRKTSRQARSFDVKNLKKKRVELPPKKKPMKRKAKRENLAPDFSEMMSGQSFGLEKFEVFFDSLDSDLLGTSGPLVMDENSVDALPQTLSQEAAVFPAKALDDNINSGLVEVRMLINSSGRVANTEILRAEPEGYFEESTLSMLQSWLFKPAQYQGQNVAIWVKQVVRFGD